MAERRRKMKSGDNNNANMKSHMQELHDDIAQHIEDDINDKQAIKKWNLRISDHKKELRRRDESVIGTGCRRYTRGEFQILNWRASECELLHSQVYDMWLLWIWFWVAVEYFVIIFHEFELVVDNCGVN